MYEKPDFALKLEKTEVFQMNSEEIKLEVKYTFYNRINLQTPNRTI